MGIASSLFAKPVGKALAKSAIKQADNIVPKIAADVAESVVADAPLPSASLATRKTRKVASEPVIKEEPVVAPQDDVDTGVNFDPLFREEEVAPTPVVDDAFMPPKVDRIEDFGVEPEPITDSGTDAFKALNFSAEKKEDWRKQNRSSKRSRLLPEIEEAAQKLFEGKLKPEEFRKLSAEKQPIVPLDKVPDVPSFTDIAGALTDPQVNKGIVGLNMKIAPGERVSSRLDITAYEDYNTWVVSLHDGSTKSGAPIGYAKTAVLKNVEFMSDPKVALDIARRKPLGSGGRMGKATIARIYGDYVPHNPDAAKAYAEKIFNDPEWTQVGMNPYRASYFYDKADNMPVVSADEIVQIGPLVMAKNVKKTSPDDALFKVNKKDDASPTFAKGGDVKNEMNRMFAEGGVMQEGGTVDPVSGNDVPPGAMKEEVRDDIDAKLSEGEFVFPADVVRYVGLETLMKIRDKAKMGLKKMEEIGQMGNAEEVPDGEALHGSEDEMDDDTFSSEIDSILSEDDGGEDRGYAAGGYVGGTANEKLYKDAPLKGFEMVAMTNSSGNIVYIPFVNGQPQLSVPAGYSVKKEGAITKSTDDKTTGITTGDGVNTTTGLYESGGDSTAGPSGPSNVGFTIGEDGLATPNETNPTVASVVGSVVGAVTGIPGLGMVGKSIAQQSNFMNSQQAMAFNVAVNDTTAAVNNEGVTTAAATTGPSGTGGAAAAAASTAADAATAAGHSVEGQAAAAQAAADATIGGQSPSAAATAAANAAASVDNGQAAEGGNTAANAAAADASAAGVGVGGVGAGNDSGGISAGEGLAKGGFVSKPKKATKQKGLASRK